MGGKSSKVKYGEEDWLSKSAIRPHSALEATARAHLQLENYKTKPRVIAEISLPNLRHNLQQISKMAAKTGCKHMLVCKGNAYGLGAAKVAEVALQEGVRAFAVATIDEALELRMMGVPSTGKQASIVLVLGAPDPSEYIAYARANIDMQINSTGTMERLKAWCKLNKKEQAIRCHIGLDTGMNRLGLETSDGNLLKTVEEIYNFITECKENDSITFAGICTHMAAATTDGPNKDVSVKQSEKFIEVFAAVEAKGLEVECFHIENSVCCMEDLLPDPTIRKRLVEHGDSKKKRATGYVRVGMAAYGYYGGPNEQKFVKPTLHFKAQIRHIQVCEKGESVSYDLTYKAPAKCIMATLSVGYADGYPRCLSNKGQVLVQGNTYTVVGTICMDMMMVSLGPLDGAGKHVAVGDYATLALTSAAGLAVDWDQVGELAGTVSTEVMCQLSSRVTRVYMGK